MKKERIPTERVPIRSDEVLDHPEKNKAPFRTYLYTLGLCIRDEGTIRIGTKEYHLRKGSLLTIGPGITCQWLSGDYRLVDTLFFYEDLFLNTFDSTFFYSLEFFCPDAHNMMALDPTGFLEMKHLFEAIRLLKEKPDVLPGIIFSILKLAQKQYWKQYLHHKKELSSKERVAARFRELVAKHATKNKDVSFYAKQLHLTPKYLTEILLHTTGMSAKKWIDHHVMQQAKYLLAHQGLSIKEVSFQLGYVDASHFVKSFKKHEGERPSDFKVRTMNALLT